MMELEAISGAEATVNDYLSPKTGFGAYHKEIAVLPELSKEYELYTNPTRYITVPKLGEVPIYAVHESGMTIFYACAKRVLINRQIILEGDYKKVKNKLKQAGIDIDKVTDKNDAMNIIRFGFLEGKGYGGWYGDGKYFPEEMLLDGKYIYNCELEHCIHIEDAIVIGLTNYERNAYNAFLDVKNDPLFFVSVSKNEKQNIKDYVRIIGGATAIFIGDDGIVDYKCPNKLLNDKYSKLSDVEDAYYPNIINMMGGVYYTLLANELGSHDFKNDSNIKKYSDFYKNHKNLPLNETVKKDTIDIVHQILIASIISRENVKCRLYIYIKREELEMLFNLFFEQNKSIVDACARTKNMFKISNAEQQNIINKRSQLVGCLMALHNSEDKKDEEFSKKVHEKNNKKTKRKLWIFLIVIVVINIIFYIGDKFL